MFGWHLLTPAFLAGAAAVAVPIALHLLSRRTAPIVPFSAVRFLGSTPVERARWRHVRDVLLLALRVAAILALAVAFARPYTDVGASGTTASATIIALDTSASMSGVERFERARQLAIDAAQAEPADRLVGVVTFADEAEVVVVPTADRGRVMEGIRAAQPGYGATRYGGALAGALSALGKRSGRIVVVTDLQRSGWEVHEAPGVPPDTAVVAIDVGPPVANLALTDVRVNDGRLTATVTAYGRAPASTTLTLDVDGVTVERLDATVTADGPTEATFARPIPEAGDVRVAVEDGSGLPADDERFLVLGEADAPRVLVIDAGHGGEGGAFFVDRALRSRSEARAVHVRVEGAWTGEPSAEERPDVVVFVRGGTEGVDTGAFGAYLDRGGAVILIAGPDLDLDTFGRGLGITLAGGAARAHGGPVTLAATEMRHPVFRPLGTLIATLGRVRVDRHVVLTSADEAAVIARFSDGDPALVEFRRGAGRALVLASDMAGAWNDLPLHPVFVPLVHALVGYLAPAPEHPATYTVARAPRGAEPRPGVAVEPTSGRRVAVNVDARESIFSRLSTDEFTAPIASLGRTPSGSAAAVATEREAEQGYWQYGLLLMLVTLVVEGLVSRRVA